MRSGGRPPDSSKPLRSCTREALTRKGKASVRRLKRALILLATDDGDVDDEIAAKVRVHRTTVEEIRQALC